MPVCAISVVAVDAFAALVSFLSFDGQSGDWSRLETFESDGFTGLFTIAVSAVFDSLQGGIDLCNKLALPVARPQLDGPISLGGGSIGEISVILILVLEVLERLSRLRHDVLLPMEQLLPEVLPLALIHERLSVRWTIVLVFLRGHALSPPTAGAIYKGRLVLTTPNRVGN